MPFWKKKRPLRIDVCFSYQGIALGSLTGASEWFDYHQIIPRVGESVGLPEVCHLSVNREGQGLVYGEVRIPSLCLGEVKGISYSPKFEDMAPHKSIPTVNVIVTLKEDYFTEDDFEPVEVPVSSLIP